MRRNTPTRPKSTKLPNRFANERYPRRLTGAVARTVRADVYRKIQREVSTTSRDIGKSALQHQPDEQLVAKLPVNIGRIDLGIREEIHKSDGSLLRSDDQKSQMGSTAGNNQDRILEFVRIMGGFDAAREAITELERSLKQLMK